MKLRYLFTALLFTGAAAPLQAQSIDHMRKLLQEIQQEIDCLEKEQARRSNRGKSRSRSNRPNTSTG